LPNTELYLNQEIKSISTKIPTEVRMILHEIERIKYKSQNRKVIIKTTPPFFQSFLDTLTTDVRRPVSEVGNKIIRVDQSGEITKLSYLFQNSFNWRKGFNKNNLELLGQANFMIWTAYSIYDGIIDNDMNPGNVPAANICQRKALEIYKNIPINFNFVLSYLTKVDNANFWETTHCRFNQTTEEVNILHIPHERELEKLLSDRAIAHVIGPLCIAFENRLSTDNFKLIEMALTYYCIARQLNDDIHDWVEDFNEGRITFVVARLLKSAKAKLKKDDKILLLSKMKKVFYDTELEALCLSTELYVNKTKKLLYKAGFEINSKFIDQFISPIGLYAYQARQIHLTNQTTSLEVNITQ